MNRIKFILIICGLIQPIFGFSLGCRDIMTSKDAVSKGLKSSDIVFLGELVKTDTIMQTYAFRTIEIFKGTTKSDTIYGTATLRDSYLPTDFCLWIVYAKYNKDSTIDINFCGPTISINSPDYFNPPPASILYTTGMSILDKINVDIRKVEYKSKGINKWINDIEKLRYYKGFADKKEQKQQTDYKLIFLIISFLINVFMFSVIMMYLRKK